MTTHSNNQGDADKITINDGVCTINFRYPYRIELCRIKTERDLLAWVLHLAGKSWMNADRIFLFIMAVAEVKGFRLTGL